MLGKRSRIMPRTTNTLQTGVQFPMESSPLTQYPKDRLIKPTSTVLRQVIGFNPTPQCQIGQGEDGLSNSAPIMSDQRTVLEGKQGGTSRGAISPRSALQSLLRAARQGEEKEAKASAPTSPVKENELDSEGHKADDREQIISETPVKYVQMASITSALKQTPAVVPWGTTRAIGLAAVPEEPVWKKSSCDDHMDFGTDCISDTNDRLQNASASNACSRTHASKSRFLFLATSPATDATTGLPSMDFLDSCYLCKRRLGQGLDIFMYNGDKAFCSMECRYQQIVMDERKEKCPPTVLRSGTVAAGAHHRRSLFATGTAAAA